MVAGLAVLPPVRVAVRSDLGGCIAGVVGRLIGAFGARLRPLRLGPLHLLALRLSGLLALRLLVLDLLLLHRSLLHRGLALNSLSPLNLKLAIAGRLLLFAQARRRLDLLRIGLLLARLILPDLLLAHLLRLPRLLLSLGSRGLLGVLLTNTILLNFSLARLLRLAASTLLGQLFDPHLAIRTTVPVEGDLLRARLEARRRLTATVLLAPGAPGAVVTGGADPGLGCGL